MHVYALTRAHIMVVHVQGYKRRQLLAVHHLSIRFARPGFVVHTALITLWTRYYQVMIWVFAEFQAATRRRRRTFILIGGFEAKRSYRLGHLGLTQIGIFFPCTTLPCGSPHNQAHRLSMSPLSRLDQAVSFLVRTMNCVSLDSEQKRRERDAKFKMTKYTN